MVLELCFPLYAFMAWTWKTFTLFRQANCDGLDCQYNVKRETNSFTMKVAAVTFIRTLFLLHGIILKFYPVQ